MPMKVTVRTDHYEVHRRLNTGEDWEKACKFVKLHILGWKFEKKQLLKHLVFGSTKGKRLKFSISFLMF